MATQGAPDPKATPDPKQMMEAGARALADGLKQAQDFWMQAAKGWGEAAGAWMGQFARPAATPTEEASRVLREISEASFAVGQAWMRLPMSLTIGAPPAELQAALTRLMESQGRAYQLWIDFLNRAARPPR